MSEASKMGRVVEELIARVSLVEDRLRSRHRPDDDDETRLERYQEAFQRALSVRRRQERRLYPFETEEEEEEEEEKDVSESMARRTTVYTWDELDAISWAAFSTSESLSLDEVYRLAALDNDCLTNRLQLATYWLSDVLQDVKQAI